MNRNILVLGGARSGKSSFAQKFCEESGKNLYYIATSGIYDSEMQERINLHKNQRDERWKTIECEYDIFKEIDKLSSENNCIMIDCLTIWLNNIMYKEYDLKEYKTKLKNSLLNSKSLIVLVSNELGQGIVPDNKLARVFRDEQGWLNQEIAKICDEVYFLIAGLKQKLK